VSANQRKDLWAVKINIEIKLLIFKAPFPNCDAFAKLVNCWPPTDPMPALWKKGAFVMCWPLAAFASSGMDEAKFGGAKVE